MHGLGITHVGVGVAKALCREFETLDALMAADVETLVAIDDVGEVIAKSVHEWFQSRQNQKIISALDREGLNFQSAVYRPTDAEGVLAGKTLVLTGTLPVLKVGRYDLPGLSHGKYRNAEPSHQPFGARTHQHFGPPWHRTGGSAT